MRWFPQCTRLATLTVLSEILLSPVSAFLGVVHSPYTGTAHRASSSHLDASCNCQQELLGGNGLNPLRAKARASIVRCTSGNTGRLDPRESRSRLWMSAPAPPVKPPKKRGFGGGGGGDDLFVRELAEPEKTRLLSSWKAYAKADGGAKFFETIEIIDNILEFKSGIIGGRKRNFCLACCKGSAVQAVACLQIGPRNEDITSFLANQPSMSLVYLTVDPRSPKFKAGAHLCKEIKEMGRAENIAVSFQPIKHIYSGRFYAAALSM